MSLPSVLPSRQTQKNCISGQITKPVTLDYVFDWRMLALGNIAGWIAALIQLLTSSLTSIYIVHIVKPQFRYRFDVFLGGTIEEVFGFFINGLYSAFRFLLLLCWLSCKRGMVGCKFVGHGTHGVAFRMAMHSTRNARNPTQSFSRPFSFAKMDVLGTFRYRNVTSLQGNRLQQITTVSV